MDKKKVILTSLASVAVLGASVLVSQPSVVKADEGKVEEQVVAPAQPQAGTEGESVAQTEKESENASPANSDTTNPAKMTKEELMKALDELEEQAISDIEDKEAIEDKEDAAEAVKEYIGKMYISDTLESGELSLDNIIAELPEGAEDKAVVTGPEVQTNKKLSTEEKALLDQAEKDAKEQVSQATDALVQALESLENAVIEDIKKDASITDKEAAIKEAKEEIGKEDLLKAIADEDLEIGDVIVDWPADTSEHKTVAEPVSEFTDEDQAKLDEADKEAQVDVAKVRSDLIATLEKIEKSTIDDINKDATITDKEAAIKAAKEVIGKDGILKAIDEGDIEASDLLSDFLAEDSDKVTPAEAMSQEDFSSQDQAKLAAADKEAAEEVAKVRSELLSTLEGIEKSTIEDINKDATITDKEAAIKAAKEVIGKDGILKAIDEGDIEASDLLSDFLAEDSDKVTPAEAMSQEDFSSQDQAKLAAADKEAAEENSDAKKLELSKLEEQVAKIKAQLSSLQVSGDKNSQVKDLQQALVDYEDAIKILSSVMSAVLEIEDFKGGVNAVEAATAELPEYNKGVNAVEAVVNELPAYGESGTPAVANVPAYGESGVPAVANVPAYGESGAPAVANVPVYAESGTPTVANIPAYGESGTSAVANIPAYAESGAPAVANVLAYGESGVPAVANIPVYAESGVPAVANVPAYAESGVPAVANIPVYAESGAPAVANIPVYAESGAPAVVNVPAYAESGTPAVANVPSYAESGAPAVNEVPVYGESGTPAVANVPVYAETGTPAVATIPAYAEKIEPAVNEVPEYTGSVAPLATNPTLGTEQDRTYKAPAAIDEQLLPNTGSQDASAVASLGFVGLLLGLLPFAKRKLNK